MEPTISQKGTIPCELRNGKAESKQPLIIE